MSGGGGGGGFMVVPTFDAESKSAKVQNTICPMGVGGGGGGHDHGLVSSQHFMVSPNPNFLFQGERGRGKGPWLCETSGEI